MSTTPGLSQHVLTRKVMRALRRLWAFLRLFDPALPCQLCEPLVSLVLRCASEVWAGYLNLKHAAEVLHCQVS